MKIRVCPLVLLSLILVLFLSCSQKKAEKAPEQAGEQPVTDAVVKPPIMNHVEYNTSTKELFVFYDNGDQLGFKDVPKDVYRELITAGSRNAVFEGKIKGVYAEFSPPERTESAARQKTK